MLEFNIKNEAIKKKYEEALLNGRHRDEKTVREVWRNICLLENFTKREDFILFAKSSAIEFKNWLAKRTNQNNELISLSTTTAILYNIREFFGWLLRQKGYRQKLDGDIIDYLYLSDKEQRAARASLEKTPPTVSEIETALLAMSYETDIEKRNRALIAFTILTGARVNALISFKVKDFDITRKTVWQDPRHVATKFSKGIFTRLMTPVLPIAEKIFLEWLDFAINELKFKPNEPIFPKSEMGRDPLTNAFGGIKLSRDHWQTTQSIREIFKVSFNDVSLPYFTPHLFRNTIIKWANENCTSLEFKAISQNLGHESVKTSISAYATLSNLEQEKAIVGIGKMNSVSKVEDLSEDELFEIIKGRFNRK